MKRIYLLAMAMMAAIVMSAAECQDGPYGLQINGSTVIDAPKFGDTDMQGRVQYKAGCVKLAVGDIVKLINQSCDATWMVDLDPYGSYQNFEGGKSANQLTCKVAGQYDFYIKMKMNDDLVYIGPAEDCKNDDGGGNSGYKTSTPSQNPGVILQGFYWNSNDNSKKTTQKYGMTNWIFLKDNAAEIGDWFDYVWLPPSCRSTGGAGYIPTQYSNLTSQWGQKESLQGLIDSLHAHGCRVVADMVINHAGGSTSWCKFYANQFTPYGQFVPRSTWICKTDEMNNAAVKDDAGDCYGKAGGGYDDGYGDEANYGAARDWDHSKDSVRMMMNAYAKWQRYVIGYDGFRYDYCKGFHSSHIDEYNKAARAEFSVMEYWDANMGTIRARISESNWNTCAFDFGTYYSAFKEGIAAGNYNGCKGSGMLGAGLGRYAVTFVDSHDTFDRYEEEGDCKTTDVCGQKHGESIEKENYKNIVLQCNAFLLSMPGTPCVFFPHWVTFKNEIKAMINARYKVGVHNESAVSDEPGNGYYKATITGTNGTIRLLIGPNSGYNTTPSGYTKAASGTNWGVYYKMNSNRGDKNTNRVALERAKDPDFTTAIPSIESAPKANAVKSIENGNLFIETNGYKYNVFGRRVR